MKGPNADDWLAAAQTEIDILEKIGAWEVVDYYEAYTVLPSTWEFRLKRFLDGMARVFSIAL